MKSGVKKIKEESFKTDFGEGFQRDQLNNHNILFYIKKETYQKLFFWTETHKNIF